MHDIALSSLNSVILGFLVVLLLAHLARHTRFCKFPIFLFRFFFLGVSGGCSGVAAKIIESQYNKVI